MKPWALRAAGIHELGAEARKRMRPDSPDLVADQFHPWVWEAAAPLWEAGSTQEAVHAAARSVNARLRQKLSRQDRSESALCRELPAGYATEDGVGLHYIGPELHEAVAVRDGAQAWWVEPSPAGGYHDEPIPPRTL